MSIPVVWKAKSIKGLKVDKSTEAFIKDVEFQRQQNKSRSKLRAKRHLKELDAALTIGLIGTEDCIDNENSHDLAKGK